MSDKSIHALSAKDLLVRSVSLTAATAVILQLQLYSMRVARKIDIGT